MYTHFSPPFAPRSHPFHGVAIAGSHLVTTCYDCSIVAEQEHARKSWMSRVKRQPKCYDLTNILAR